MRRVRIALRALTRVVFTGLLALGLTVPAAAWPDADRPVRLVVPFAAGGGVDAAARLFAAQLRLQLGHAVIVDNRPGGNGTLGARLVMGAPADGHTLLFSAPTQVMARQVMVQPPYDPQTDFTPVARVGSAPLMLVVRRDAPARWPELLAAMRRQAEPWSAGVAAAGAPGHLATLRLMRQARLRLTIVPYTGTQPALLDVAGGHLDLLVDSMVALLPMARNGRVQPVAVTAARRSPLAPELPTLQESGLPGFVADTWYGVWGPAALPPERVAAIHAALSEATAQLARSGALGQLGIEPVVESTEQFRHHVAAAIEQGTELLRQADFRRE